MAPANLVAFEAIADILVGSEDLTTLVQRLSNLPA